MIQNPILPGFHPDPSICRRGDDFYLAVSSFEWFPGIPVYHSRDLKHWEKYAHVCREESALSLVNLPSAKGLWAPSLTYDDQSGLFYCVYGIMRSMHARYFDVDNFLVCAPDPRGPWSKPQYLHSAGFDASLFHDRDGKKYLLSLLWETRDGYEKPGTICIAEYDSKKRQIKGTPQSIYRGGTDRGCLEAPFLYRHGDFYYLLCAEGGTGYYHCVTVARAKSPFGPFTPDPENPLLTSVPENYNERADTDHLKTRYYNPLAPLQKAGHASLTETAEGEVYLAHLCARPLVPALACPLGRETALQKAEWTPDGWLRLASGGKLVQRETPESALPASPFPERNETTRFHPGELPPDFYAPRIDPASFASLPERESVLRLRGQESLSSTHRVSLFAKKLTTLHTDILTKMTFSPTHFCHSAGLCLYYDNMNYAFLRKTYSDKTGGEVLTLTRVDNGKKTDRGEVGVPSGTPLWLRLRIAGSCAAFSYSTDGVQFTLLEPTLLMAEFSDEYSEFGEFTGCFAGLAAVDALFRKKTADFSFFTMKMLPGEP